MEGFAVTSIEVFAYLVLLAFTGVALEAAPRQTVLLVVGAPGEAAYAEQFAAWADHWRKAAARSGARLIEIDAGAGSGTTDRERLRDCLAAECGASTEPLWLVFLGHGTFDNRHAKFNLRGPDVSAAELAEWLQTCSRSLAIVNCASASGPFINQLSGKSRVVVTATKSGAEQNFARFGEYLSSAVGDEQADLDKDGETSLLEAFLSASARVDEFYEQDARLATEHALIDDNGDSLGTPADWFRGVRAVRSAKDALLPDGPLAHQFCLVRSPHESQMPAEVRTRRNALELEVARLREQKSQLAEDEYYGRLETLLVELAQLYKHTAAAVGGP